MKVDLYVGDRLIATGAEMPKKERLPRKLKKRLQKRLLLPFIPRSSPGIWSAEFEGVDLSHLKI